MDQRQRDDLAMMAHPIEPIGQDLTSWVVINTRAWLLKIA